MECAYDINEHCTFLRWSEEVKNHFVPLCCGNADLDDFFANDAVLYDKELLGKTYIWATDEYPHKIVAAVTLANDSIKSKLLAKSALNKLNRPISNHKRGRSYPAALIGRLGVDIDYQGGGKHVGTQVVNFLKAWFRKVDNKTGCRFLVVDAYNEPNVLPFYESCGFRYLYSNEAEERAFFGMDTDEALRTRLMYVDLK